MVKKLSLAVLIGCLDGLEDLEDRQTLVLIMNKLCIAHKCRVNYELESKHILFQKTKLTKFG